MAQIDKMTLEMEYHVGNAQIVKNMVIDRLKKDGIITEEQSEEFLTKYQIIIIKRKWFQAWWDKFFDSAEKPQDKEGNSYQYKLVKFED